MVYGFGPPVIGQIPQLLGVTFDDRTSPVRALNGRRGATHQAGRELRVPPEAVKVNLRNIREHGVRDVEQASIESEICDFAQVRDHPVRERDLLENWSASEAPRAQRWLVGAREKSPGQAASRSGVRKTCPRNLGDAAETPLRRGPQGGERAFLTV